MKIQMVPMQKMAGSGLMANATISMKMGLCSVIQQHQMVIQ